MSDFPDFSSRRYQPSADKCCERCVFGRGEHAEWCKEWQGEDIALMDFEAAPTLLGPLIMREFVVRTCMTLDFLLSIPAFVALIWWNPAAYAK